MSEDDRKKAPLGARVTGKLKDNLKKFLSPSRAGAELSAYGRGGLKDLQDYLKPFPDSPAQHEENGMFASPTPQMVTDTLEPGRDAVAAELARMRGNDHTQSRGR